MIENAQTYVQSAVPDAKELADGSIWSQKEFENEDVYEAGVLGASWEAACAHLAVVTSHRDNPLNAEVVEADSNATAEKPRYIPWAYAGGPNECSHGYAAGIPCPDCDVAQVPATPDAIAPAKWGERNAGFWAWSENAPVFMGTMTPAQLSRFEVSALVKIERLKAWNAALLSAAPLPDGPERVIWQVDVHKTLGPKVQHLSCSSEEDADEVMDEAERWKFSASVDKVKITTYRTVVETRKNSGAAIGD